MHNRKDNSVYIDLPLNVSEYDISIARSIFGYVWVAFSERVKWSFLEM